MNDGNRPFEVQPAWSHVELPAGTLPFDPALEPLPPKWSAPLADAPASDPWQKFEEIKISCTSTNCGANLHCFKLTKKLAQTLGPGMCRDCGRALVSLARTAERNLDDIDNTFASLQLECIRHYFWHVPFGQKALDYAFRAGRLKLEARATRRIRSRIGSAEPFRDGQQTPISRMRADALDYAMHAVAACCRKCASYWHGIEIGLPLSEAEVMYLSELACRYLRARLPNLPNGPSYVPRRRRGGAVPSLPTSEVTEAKSTEMANHPQAS
jgi:hypothetical protein